MAAAAARGGAQAESGALDIRDAAGVDRAFDAARDAARRLDIVDLHAGINVRKPILEYTDEEFDRACSTSTSRATSTCCAPPAAS